MMAHVSGPAAARVAAPRPVRVRAALLPARGPPVAGQAGAGAVQLWKEKISGVSRYSLPHLVAGAAVGRASNEPSRRLKLYIQGEGIDRIDHNAWAALRQYANQSMVRDPIF